MGYAVCPQMAFFFIGIMPIISIWGWSDFLSNPRPSSNCEVLWQATHAVAEDEGVGDEQILEEPAVWVVRGLTYLSFTLPGEQIARSLVAAGSIW